MPTAMKMAQRVAEHSPLAIQVSKHCLLKLCSSKTPGRGHLLVYCGAFLARLSPYFFRSFMRESRVSKP